MRIDMQAKPCYSSVVENRSLRRVEYDENSEPVDVLKRDHETKGEMDSMAKPSAADKSAPLVKGIKDNVDLCITSELAPDIRNTHMPEVTIASGSHLSVCWSECGKCGLRDIEVDESFPSEDKVLISLDHNIYSGKQSAMKSLCSGGDLVSNECKEEDQYLSGHDRNGFDKDALSHSQLKNITEYEREMVDDTCILKSLTIDGESATSSSKENNEIKHLGSIHCFDECVSVSTILKKKENVSAHLRKDDDACDEKRCNISTSDSVGLEGKFETSSVMQSVLLGTFVEKVGIVPDDTSSKNRESEVDFSVCGDGGHDRTITSTINCESESLEVQGKMKDRALPSQENAEPHLLIKFQTSNNPFAAEEEEKAHLNSYCASWVSHLTATVSPVGVQVFPNLLSEFTCSSKTEAIAPKAVDTLEMDPSLGKQVLSEQTLAPAMDHKKIIEESCSDKCGNPIDSATLDESMRISISKSATAGSHATNHTESQTPNNLGSSPFGWKSVGEIHSNTPTQSINQEIYDRSDKVNINYSEAEMSVFAILGPNFPSGPLSCSGPLSARASYSGQIPHSGSISHGSDSSAGSTRSFAFPILPNEWNSSPVKMKEADSKRKRRDWFNRFCCFICYRP